jgi:hypothetical protein
MNTANLQLEGLYLAVAAINAVLVKKGILSRDEIDFALSQAEQTAINDDRSMEDLSPANRDAVAFPMRLLRIANESAPDGDLPSFGTLAKLVGQTKMPYNDQL